MSAPIDISTMSDLRAFARSVARKLSGGEVIGLVGGLGAGKTTFTQLLAREIGVQAEVKSPTFVIMQTYDAAPHRRAPRLRLPGSRRLPVVPIPFTTLCHVDAYRLADVVELRGIGFEEYAGEPDTVTIVEWADRIPELRDLPGYRELSFRFRPDGGREVVMDWGSKPV